MEYDLFKNRIQLAGEGGGKWDFDLLFQKRHNYLRKKNNMKKRKICDSWL